MKLLMIRIFVAWALGVLQAELFVLSIQHICKVCKILMLKNTDCYVAIMSLCMCVVLLLFFSFCFVVLLFLLPSSSKVVMIHVHQFSKYCPALQMLAAFRKCQWISRFCSHIATFRVDLLWLISFFHFFFTAFFSHSLTVIVSSFTACPSLMPNLLVIPCDVYF